MGTCMMRQDPTGWSRFRQDGNQESCYKDGGGQIALSGLDNVPGVEPCTRMDYLSDNSLLLQASMYSKYSIHCRAIHAAVGQLTKLGLMTQWFDNS